jgi:hypothetical protein
MWQRNFETYTTAKDTYVLLFGSFQQSFDRRTIRGQLPYQPQPHSWRATRKSKILKTNIRHFFLALSYVNFLSKTHFRPFCITKPPKTFGRTAGALNLIFNN